MYRASRPVIAGFFCVSPITVKLNASAGSTAVVKVSTALRTVRPSASVHVTR
jgi:hypothetical protein